MARRGRPTRYPLHTLRLGETHTLVAEAGDEQRIRHNLYNAIRKYRLGGGFNRFASTKQPGAILVTRVG